MRFESPLALLLLLSIPLLLEAGTRRRLCALFGIAASADAALAVSSPVSFAALPQTWRVRYRSLILNLLLVGSFVALVVALARPQTGTYFAESLSSGRDLLLVLDVSGSMEALDFELNGQHVTRLAALQSVTKEFIEKRKGDRMGLVLFGSNAFTQCPLTLDQAVLTDFIDGLEIGMVGEGTAIGDALAVGLKRVKEIEADSKVIILVTDGMQTAGNLTPNEVAKIAQELGIKIYTIGIGGSGPAPFRSKDVFGRDIVEYAEVPLDEKTLKEVAESTGGRYFNAKNTAAFAEVYASIDQLETRDEQTLEYIEYKEQFLAFALLGLVLFVMHELLAATVLLKLP